MTPRPLWTLLPAALLTANSAVAAPPSIQTLQQWPAAIAGAKLKEIAKAQRLQPRRADLDGTPPTLAAITVGTRVEIGTGGASLPVDIRLADDWSGLDRLMVGMQHEDGSMGVGYWFDTYWGSPAQHVKGRLWLDAFYHLKPGRYKVNEVYATDLAGNVATFDRAQLEALGGNLDFEVQNKQYDGTPPSLKKGKLLTPSVSRSSAWPGTASEPAMVVAEVVATDPRQHHRSGANWVLITLCKNDGVTCLWVSGGGVDRATRSPLRLGATVRPEEELGTYHIRTVEVHDNMYNRTTYLSTRFGGTTDFRQYFPETQVEVTP